MRVLPSILVIGIVAAAGCGGSGTGNGPSAPRGTGGLTIHELSPDRVALVESYPVATVGAATIPATFDGRTAWIDANGNSCLTPAWDQGNTDFCWAFSSSTSASDRYRIANATTPTGPFFETTTFPGYSGGGKWNGPPRTVLNGFAPMATGECSVSGSTKGCSQTGNPMEGFHFLYTHGGPLLAEWGVSSCQGSCPSFSGVSLYKCGMPYRITDGSPWKKKNVELIQREVLANGPVTTYIRIAPQFDQWWQSSASATDVFGPDDTGGKKYNAPGNPTDLPGHLVVIVGWGTSSSGEDYWLIRNSWGQIQADAGYFRLSRGVNFVSCETFVEATHPGSDVPIGSTFTN